MSDPQLLLQQALIAALNTPSIAVSGAVVKAYTHPPLGTRPPYILVTQPTMIPGLGSVACQVWECTYLLDIVTSFATAGQVSDLPSFAISGQLLSRLHGKRLPLADGYQMAPVAFGLANTVTDAASGETVDVHRYVRVRFQLQYNAPLVEAGG
ncbi:hypothetical protein [Hymenobacter sp. BT491]|uniref:hypothetical protein n=1 Tax=Hymenobacter sp. BT491 TaxID=2766779 RepID=UPI001653AE13|nr:hypothetical protein [Hymenobacter sp. BT491]MBC6988935.1 hypothetical protein [Hymenobacter sp. BT491]